MSILNLSICFVLLIALQVNSDDTIELMCSSDEDCHTFGDSEIAVKCYDTCVCFLKKNGSKTSCTPKNLKVYNEISACPCRVVNTECKNDICVCKKGFIKSEDKLKCLTKIVQLGKSCDVDIQCKRFERNSECRGNICQCKENFFQINNTCRSLAVKEGEKQDTACDIQNYKCGPNQECIKNKCVCNHNYIFGLNNTECIPYAKYGDDCIDQIQCYMGIGNGTMCENKKCACDKYHSKAFINEKYICQRNVNHMQECHKDTDCARYFDDPRMWCVKNKCICSEGYHLSDGIHMYCVPDEIKTSSAANIYSSFFIIIVTLILSFYFM